MKGCYLLAIIMVLIACTSKNDDHQTLMSGNWRAVIETQGKEIPFNMLIESNSENNYNGYLVNGEEKILIRNILIKEDSVIIPMHIFDSEIRALVSKDQLTGIWKKNYVKDYILPFRAVFNETHRFSSDPSSDVSDISGKYSIHFIHGDDSSYAIGLFNQSGSSLSATFMTPTGDYRFLEGEINGKNLFLSTFDGEHAYLFEANIDEGRLKGEFWSGKSWHTAWVGIPDQNASLPDPYTMTYLKKGYDQLEFSFPDLNGRTVSLKDDKFSGKVTIIQIFGTWCPNCMDETRFLANYYDRYKDSGLEIIGLAFENSDDFDYAVKRVRKVVDIMNVKYDFLIAGQRKKNGVEEALPMLENFRSYPTTIFIDKQGEVRRIHAGFTGPGTGMYYEKFAEDFDMYVQALINE